MNKREKMIGIFMVSLIAIWALLSLSGKEKKRPVVKVKQKPSQQKQKVVAEVEIPDESEPHTKMIILDTARVAAYKRAGLQKIDPADIIDPFRKLEAQDALLTLSDLFLSGTSLTEGKHAAVINDKIIRPGEKIAGFEVREIRADEVILHKGDERYILKFSSSSRKTGSAPEVKQK